MADSQTFEHGPEMNRLLDRLFGDPKRKLVHFNVFWGDDAPNLTVEERAAAINRAMDTEVEVSPEEIDGPLSAPVIEVSDPDWFEKWKSKQ